MTLFRSPDNMAAMLTFFDLEYQFPPFVSIEHRRLAGFHNMLRAAHRGRRVHRHHLAGDEPVEQHPHGRKLLLHARRPVVLLQLLHPGCHIERPDGRERQTAIFAPGKKPGARPRVSPTCVVVVDVGGEEFDVAPAGRVVVSVPGGMMAGSMRKMHLRRGGGSVILIISWRRILRINLRG